MTKKQNCDYDQTSVKEYKGELEGVIKTDNKKNEYNPNIVYKLKFSQCETRGKDRARRVSEVGLDLYYVHIQICQNQAH